MPSTCFETFKMLKEVCGHDTTSCAKVLLTGIDDYRKEKNQMRVLLLVSRMRFQMGHRFSYEATDSVCKRVRRWSRWHDFFPSFYLFSQYSEILEVGFLKLLDGFEAFC